MTSVDPDDVRAGQSATDGGAVQTVRRVAHLLRPRKVRFGIQSKVMVALLLSSIVSVAVIGFIGAIAGRTALRQVESERLIELRQSQKRQIESLFREIVNSMVVYSENDAIVAAVNALTAGFAQMDNATITPDQEHALADYYRTQMIEPIKNRTGTEIDLAAVMPSSRAQRYVQANFTAVPWNPADVRPPGPADTWAAAYAHYDGVLRDIVTRFKYNDALMFDTDGNLVYSVRRGPDLGTNIHTGPYRGTKLRGAYDKVVNSNGLNFVWITDFQPYQPDLDAPTAWVVTALGRSGEMRGVLALPVPVAKINNIMTANKQWESAGVGRSTETYLAGPDDLMRSDSRLFIEDPKAYRREVIAAGTPPDVADRALRLGGTTLVQPVPGPGLRAAQRGENGVVSGTDYTGQEELQAYAPLDIPSSELRWSILATRNNSAAYARLVRFSQILATAVTAVIFGICVVSMLIAQASVRPLRRLEEGTRRISAGDYAVDIPVKSHDEVGDLTVAFNEMSKRIALRDNVVAKLNNDIDRMLRALMPEDAVRAYRDGDHSVADKYTDGAVIYAAISGLDTLADDGPAADLVEVVDELYRQFDASADTLAVDPIRVFHNGYLATTGMVSPRLDSIHRGLDFAQELRRIVDRFNNQANRGLAISVGVTTGTVVNGLVGRGSLAYDAWGSAITMAQLLAATSGKPGVYASAQAYDSVHEVRSFVAAGTVTVDGVEQPVYRLAER